MVRDVLENYRYGIRNGLKNIVNSGQFLWIYIFVVNPTSPILKKYRQYGKYGTKIEVAEMVTILLFTIIYLIPVMYPNMLNKMMNLCPLTTVEKQKYIRTALKTKMLFSIISGTVLLTVIWSLKLIPLEMFLVSVWTLITFTVTVNICCPLKMYSLYSQQSRVTEKNKMFGKSDIDEYEDYYDSENGKRRTFSLSSIFIFFRIVNFILSYIMIKFIYEISIRNQFPSSQNPEVTKRYYIAALCFLFLNSMICLRVIRKHYKKSMDIALNRYV